ncbi:MAG: efflux RND transporter periplasmic adaptor subunit, partial [Hyphomicrobiaceae bacterium]
FCLLAGSGAGRRRIQMRQQWQLTAGVLPVLLLSGCGDGDQKAKAASPPPAVTVVAVVEHDIKPSLTFSGRVQARDKVDLRARVEGFLEKRLFNEGQDVKKGDLLFVIEQAPYKASIAEIKATIQKAQAVLTLADLEVARASQLVAREVGTQKRLDETTAQQGNARGELARQKAALEKAELDLSYTDIRAPLAGRIGRSQFSVGNFVGPASGTLATIVSQDPIDVTFPVTQREVLSIRKARREAGDASEDVIYVQLADGSRYSQRGTLNFVDVTVSQGTDTVQVRATFPNPDRLLVDGQLVSVIAESGKAESALQIPQQAVQIDQGGPFVLIVDSASKVEVRRVETGPLLGTRLAVAKGLSAGEKVITEGVQKVRPGQIVQATEVKPGA